MSRHAVLSGAPLLIAHRGGAGLAPENTLAAFHNAVDSWAADMVELDVHASADGHCVVIHDGTVDRTTNGTGTVAARTLAQLQSLDAGYRFSTDGGASFPLRESGVTIPTFAQVLEQLPADTRVTVELKTGAAQDSLAATIKRFNAYDRVIVAGMYEADRTQFWNYPGAISASGDELRRFLKRHYLFLGRLLPPRADVVQMCEEYGGRRLLTRRLVQQLKRLSIPVHVWTVNDVADMQRLLDWGVEGILTDRPDVLGLVLHERCGRPLAPGHGAARA